MPDFSLVVACTHKGGIGFENKMPWHIKEDFQHFKKLTTQTSTAEKWNVVIMGRKTWDSLPKKPLPERLNIVISRQKNLIIDAIVCSSLNLALRQCQKFSDVIENIFVIGGAEIYKNALKNENCKHIYMTRVLFREDEPEIDTFVSEFEENKLLKKCELQEILHTGENKNVQFTMVKYFLNPTVNVEK